MSRRYLGKKPVEDIEVTNEITVGDIEITVPTAGQDTTLTVTDSTWVKVERSGSTTPTGSGRLTDRKSLKMTNRGSVNLVTTVNANPNTGPQSTDVGDVIKPDSSQIISFADASTADVWVKSLSGNVTLFFRETGA